MAKEFRYRFFQSRCGFLERDIRLLADDSSRWDDEKIPHETWGYLMDDISDIWIWNQLYIYIYIHVYMYIHIEILY